MNCWSCGNELMWNSDYDIGDENEYFKLLTILTCSKCKSMVECYHERKEKEDEENN